MGLCELLVVLRAWPYSGVIQLWLTAAVAAAEEPSSPGRNKKENFFLHALPSFWRAKPREDSSSSRYVGIGMPEAHKIIFRGGKLPTTSTRYCRRRRFQQTMGTDFHGKEESILCLPELVRIVG